MKTIGVAACAGSLEGEDAPSDVHRSQCGQPLARSRKSHRDRSRLCPLQNLREHATSYVNVNEMRGPFMTWAACVSGGTMS